MKFEEDKFTHKRTATIPGGLLSSVWTLGWEANYTEGSSQIKFNLTANGIHEAVLPSGYAIKLLQNDGSVVELFTTQATVPTPSASTALGVYTAWSTVFPLPKETLAFLAAREVAAVRATLPNGDVTWEVPNSYKKAFPRAFVCLATLP